MSSRLLSPSCRAGQGVQRLSLSVFGMDIGTEVKTRGRCVGALGLLLVISLFCLPAMAALGGDLKSVQDDATHMKATVKIQHKPAYAIYQITDKSNTVVREYVSPDGLVFDVAWQGPFLPSLTQILGSYVQQYAAGVEQEHAKGPGRRPLMIHQPGLVVETSGHMRAYYGRAYVPDLLPQGVAAGDMAVPTAVSPSAGQTSTNAATVTEESSTSVTRSQPRGRSLSNSTAATSYELPRSFHDRRVGITATSNPAGTGNNVADIIVDGGPVPGQTYVNGAFATATICQPSTTNCVTVDHLLVDTGSYGLRVLQSEMNGLTLTPITSGGLTLNDCAQFVDGAFLWGEVALADVHIAGETAGNIPIHVVADPSGGFSSIPTACSNGNPNADQDNQTALGANGILGVGPEPLDCELAGVNYCDGSSPAPVYFGCPCTSGSQQVQTPDADQVENPVVAFTTDNNGVVINFPSVGAAEATASGTLTFGINTESNNTVPSTATVYQLDSSDSFSTTYDGVLSPLSYIDSGSNAYFIPNTSITICSDYTSFFCPNPNLTGQTATTASNVNNASGTVSFEIDNADNLFGDYPSDAAFGNLGGPNGSTACTGSPGNYSGSCSFDWGLTFFYGNTVFTSIDLTTVTGEPPTPWWAYGVSQSGPIASLSPSSLNFGNQTVGITSSPQDVTLTNTGNADLTITSIQIAGTNSGDFAQTNNCPASLSPNNSCQISVTFTPTATGTRNAAVSITDNAPGSPQQVPLTGVGVLPAVTLSPTSVTFPTQLIYTTSQPKPVQLTNSGQGVLLISSISVTGPFSQTNNCPSSLNPNANCTINVKFHPKNKGVFHGAVSVTDNAPGSPQQVPLKGTGTYVQLVPTKVNFGVQPVGTRSLPKKITLTNQGHETLNITTIVITGTDAGDFAETNNCGTQVKSGASCFIKVTFKPLVKGKRTADVSVYDDGGGSPQEVPLTGTGT